MNATTRIVPQHPCVSTPEGHAAQVFEQASMVELVTLGRMFWAAINSRHHPDEPYDAETSRQRDDEMDVLASFDDEISVRIIERAPRDAEERAVKASYLIARIRSDNMSEAAEELAQQWVENAAMGLV